MKNKKNLLGIAVAFAGLIVAGCGKTPQPSTSSSNTSSLNPSTSSSMSESSSSTFTREDAKKIFRNALQADYSNMIVEVSMAYDIGMGVQDEYFQEIAYEGYTIIPALYDGDTTLYYHDYEGESYLYFPDNYGRGDAWLNKGEKDAALGLENTYFSWDYSVPFIDVERVAYSSGYYVIADETLIAELNQTMFRFAWFNDIQYVTLLVSDGHITDIVGLCSLDNDDEFVKIKMNYFGNAAYNDTLPTAPNKDNVRSYYDYTGKEPVVDKYISSLEVKVEGETQKDDNYDAILDLDASLEISASYLPADANKVEITWHSSDESIVNIDYHQTSLHRILKGVKEGEAEIYATAVGENKTTVTSNKLKVKVNPVKEQNKEGCVYDFNFINIANDHVVATNNIETNATYDITSNRATLREASKVENRFDAGRQLLCLDPLATDFSKPSGAYVTFDFDDQQVSSLSLYYGMIYSTQRSYLSYINKALIMTSNDGETWTEYDFLDELKNNISVENKKLLEVSFAPASKVRIFLGASMVGNQFLFAMDNVCFMKDENCHDHEDPAARVDVTSIEIASTSTTLKVGEKTTLAANVLPSNATDKTVTWYSSDNDTLSITADGVATALKSGSVEVYAKSTNDIESNHVTITIKEKAQLPEKQIGKSFFVEEVLINSAWYDFKLNITDAEHATLEVMLENSEKQVYTFTLSDYDEDSRYYIFTNENDYSLRVKLSEFASTAEVFAELDNKVSLGNKYTNSGESFALYVASTSIQLSFEEKTMTVGEKVYLTASVLPSNASYSDVTYTNTNPEVADFESSESNYLAAKSQGTTTITFTNRDGLHASAVITVNDKIGVTSIELSTNEIASLEVGKSEKVIATVKPSDAYNQSVSWTSSNNKIATVDKNGNITGVSAGTVTITCVSNENAEIKATVKVTVVNGTGVLPSSMNGEYLDEDYACYAGQLTIVVDATSGEITLSCEDASYTDTYSFVSVDEKGIRYTFENENGNQIVIYVYDAEHIQLESGVIDDIYFDGENGAIDLYKQ